MVEKKTIIGEIVQDLVSSDLVVNHKVNTIYNRKVPVGVHFNKPSLTQQQFKDEADLNNIVDRNMQLKNPEFITKLHLMGGSVNKNEPIYGDFTTVTDYASALNMVDKARADFMSLPSNVREYFGNNPSKLMEFVSNEANYEKGVELGIFKKKVVEAQYPSTGDSSTNVDLKQPEKAGVDTISANSEMSAQ